MTEHRAGVTPHRPDGDRDRLYASYYPQLMRLGFCLTGSQHQAEDLVQDTFARCVGRIESMDNAAAYLRTTLVNGFRSGLRRQAVAARARRGERVRLPEMPRELIELRDVLLRLPDRQRAAVVLRYVADLSDAEIAVAIGCRQATVRSLIKRALDRLRKELS